MEIAIVDSIVVLESDSYRNRQTILDGLESEQSIIRFQTTNRLSICYFQGFENDKAQRDLTGKNNLKVKFFKSKSLAPPMTSSWNLRICLSTVTFLRMFTTNLLKPNYHNSPSKACLEASQFSLKKLYFSKTGQLYDHFKRANFPLKIVFQGTELNFVTSACQ